MAVFDETIAELHGEEATKNFDGSTIPNGLPDNNDIPLRAGASQKMFGSSLKDSALANPGTWSGDDRSGNPIPMYPPGHEGEGDTLFSLTPKMKG